MTLNKILFIAIMLSLFIAIKSCQWEEAKNARLQKKVEAQHVR